MLSTQFFLAHDLEASVVLPTQSIVLPVAAHCAVAVLRECV
jgi:hypothetical protein